MPTRAALAAGLTAALLLALPSAATGQVPVRPCGHGEKFSNLMASPKVRCKLAKATARRVMNRYAGRRRVTVNEFRCQKDVTPDWRKWHCKKGRGSRAKFITWDIGSLTGD